MSVRTNGGDVVSIKLFVFCLTCKHQPPHVVYACLDVTRSNAHGSTREWRHKELDNFTFVQGRNKIKGPGGEGSWNTGIWSKKLSQLARNLLCCEGIPRVQKRARHVLDMRKSQSHRGIQPSKGLSFFRFEEDLPHHVREAMVISTTGVATTFFENPYVRELMARLEPRHKPVYRRKLGRLIMVIDEVVREEVSFGADHSFVFRPKLVCLTSCFHLHVRRSSA